MSVIPPERYSVDYSRAPWKADMKVGPRPARAPLLKIRGSGVWAATWGHEPQNSSPGDSLRAASHAELGVDVARVRLHRVQGTGTTWLRSP